MSTLTLQAENRRIYSGGLALLKRIPITASVIVLLVLLHLLLHVQLLGGGTQLIVSQLTVDDTYYYLQTAWNSLSYGMTTFDGINPTNGVQLLWFWTLVLARVFIQNKDSFLFLVMHLCFLLNVLAYLFIWKIAKRVGSSAVALIMALVWFYISAHPARFLSGMENSIHAVFVWLLLWQSLEVTHRIRAGTLTRSRWLLLILILILNVWSRIDAAIYVTLFFFYFVGVLYQHRNAYPFFSYLAAALALAAGAFVLMLLLFFWMGGFPLPVSSLIKADRPGTISLESIRTVFSAIFDSAYPFREFSSLRGTRNQPYIYGFLILLPWALWFFRENRGLRARGVDWLSRFREFQPFFLLTLGVAVVELVYMAGASASILSLEWYHTPFIVLFIFVTAVIFVRASDFLPTIFTHVVRIALCAWLFICALGLSANAVDVYLTRPVDENTYYWRVEVSRWIDENIEADAIGASWNAGEYGYFSNRRIINLDGLINSYQYYSTVLAGDEPLLDYLDRNNVSFVVDYSIPQAVQDEYVILQSFPIKEGRTILVLAKPGADILAS